MSGRRLAKSAGLIGLATLTSRLLGLVREVAMGAYFGTSDRADAFVVATRIQNLLRDLFAEGGMSSAFVPTVTRYLTRGGKPAAWRLGSLVVNSLLVVTGVLVVLGIVFAEPLVSVFAGGYTDTPEKFALTVWLARINMPFLMLIAVAAACMGMLNALRRFFVPAFSPALFNVVFILCIVVLVPLFMQHGIEPALALSAGTLLGGVIQVVAQWPALRREGYRHAWIVDPRDPGLREVLMLMGPGTLGAAAAQINLLVNTSLATSQDGAASALGYAFRLMYMPIGIFSVSVATATLPDLATHAASDDHDGMKRTLSWAFRLMLMLSVPATLGLMVLASPIVELIYQHGQFGPNSTMLVASALVAYAPGIIGYSIVKIVSTSFYSLRDPRTPVVVSLIAIAINLALNVWLSSIWGFVGLAIGTTIAANINALLLLILLSKKIGGLDNRAVMVALVKIIAASLLMAVVAYGAEAILHQRFPEGTLVTRLVRVGGGVTAGIATLALSAWILRINEFRQAVGRVLARARGTASI